LEAKPAFIIGIYPSFVSARSKPTRDKTNYHLVSDESKCVFGLTGQMKQASLAVG